MYLLYVNPHDLQLIIRGHGRGVYVAAPTTFLRRDECDRPDKHRPSGSDPRSGQGDGSPIFFSKEGDASPAAASLLLLLAGDVETNPGPSCYAYGKNFRPPDTPLNCHAQGCGVRSHKQTRCSGMTRSQQSLPWHCPTHGGPGPPFTTQIPTPATAATTRSGQAPGLSPVILRAA